MLGEAVPASRLRRMKGPLSPTHYKRTNGGGDTQAQEEDPDKDHDNGSPVAWPNV